MEPFQQITERQQIIKILKKHGEDSLSYFHLQNNRRYFFSPSGKSFLSYRIWNKVAIAAGNPVGLKTESHILIQSFIQYASAWKLKPLFVGLNDKHLATLHALQMKTLKIGEEAIVDLETFDKNKLKKKARRAERHIENLGIEVFFCNPQTLPKIFYNDIYTISKKWLLHKGKKEKGFSMTLGRIPNQSDKDCQFAIALYNNSIVGFLSFTPVYTQNMLSLDISRRLENAPNGLTEFLIIKSAEYFKTKGIKKISLNFATFVGMIPIKTSIKHKVIHLTSQILKKLYNADSLHEFNQKFLPTWENRYVAYFSKRNFPLYLLAIFRAER